VTSLEESCIESVKRTYEHSNFMNLSMKGAELHLKSTDKKFLLHPSDSKMNNLILSMKFSDEVVVHKELIEGGSGSGDKDKLGNSLKI
jgi:hypothetical protein